MCLGGLHNICATSCVYIYIYIYISCQYNKDICIVLYWYKCCANARVVQRQQLTGSKHHYMFCYCPLVGILFEVLRIIKCSWYRNTMNVPVPCPQSIYLSVVSNKRDMEIPCGQHRRWQMWHISSQWLRICHGLKGNCERGESCHNFVAFALHHNDKVKVNSALSQLGDRIMVVDMTGRQWLLDEQKWLEIYIFSWDNFLLCHSQEESYSSPIRCSGCGYFSDKCVWVNGQWMLPLTHPYTYIYRKIYPYNKLHFS